MLDTVCAIVMLTLIAAFAASLIRVFIGPSLPDRVVALDMAGTVVVAFILTRCIQTGDTYYIPAAMCMALLSFVGTVAFALYIRRGGPQ